MNFRKTSVNAYQTDPSGKLTLHLEDDEGECAELTIKPHDVQRMMVAGIDALQKKRSMR